MNKSLRDRTCGSVYDTLEVMVETLAAGLADMTPAEREARWSRIQGLLKGRDTLDWAVKQAAKWEFEHGMR